MLKPHTNVVVAVLLVTLFGWTAPIAAQATKPSQSASDISGTTAQREAISRMLSQSVMKVSAPGKFAPEQAMTLREFAVSMQRLFGLTSKGEAIRFNDLSPADPDFSAIEALVPHLQRLAFCPGCSLNNTLYPDRPISTVLESVALTSVLVERKQVTLASAEEAQQVLGATANLAGLAPTARRFLATAVQKKITSLQDLREPAAISGATRAGTAVLLDTVQRQFNISIP